MLGASMQDANMKTGDASHRTRWLTAYTTPYPVARGDA